MKRTAEFVLGLIGGIFGIICAFVALLIGGMGAAFEADGANTVIGLGWGAVALSILGIVGSVMVRSKAKVGGIMMTVAAIGGFICISIIYLLPGVLLLIGGLMGIFRKDKATVSA
ncbi:MULTISPECIES: DUF4064 domain-containing protein [Bacillus]|jgi:hypothetical protein|uniref:DUF4064 domain-containing protein n=14 Tax=Bacillus cereus group TaxID=86661 RepID=A0A9X6TRE0_BACTU|nr:MULTISPECIES: DUF4064 domain-containing protein [Bacillus]EAO52130.1 hypothetical protein RBTH_02246 [Bacillus thuringiensis serovar israelensis ATCC 35646]EEM43365.1 hypothetical protein bthur0004_6210 [Bacillus thuringiensis serovar sotto str. T04001]MDV8112199.1 DUF4064 domain-containing protein [Bacillus sp. BAU-SS-2023]MED1152959.1 DUF4064 domain-containing protein [Bacillus paranthracis]OUB20666.1 hypothetical protein BK708_18505 [Bacillus thuringiensis serovar yunnanensis]PPI92013.1